MYYIFLHHKSDQFKSEETKGPPHPAHPPGLID